MKQSNNEDFKPRVRNKNQTHLEIKTIEQLGNQREGGEEDLQCVDVFGMSLTQLNGGLKPLTTRTLKSTHCLITAHRVN